MNSDNTTNSGFTLSELLISLSVLGLISALTLPNVYNSVNKNKNNAVAKETFQMISQAFEMYSTNNSITASTSINDLLPYMNYREMDTSGTLVDLSPLTPGANRACNTANPCLQLLNGGAIWLYDGSLGGTTEKHCLTLLLDPNGKYDNNKDGLWLLIYSNGRVLTSATALDNSTTGSGEVFSAIPGDDPTWFSW